MTQILIVTAIVVAALVCMWFFVIHKHVSTIHSKIDTILNRVSGPKVQSTVTNSPTGAKITVTSANAPITSKPI